MVDLRTDVACTVVDANGVTISVGAPNDENTGIATKTTSCDAGSIGTVALTPGGDIGGPVAVRVVLGVNAHADDCSSANKYAGCIVARRSLRYSPHAELYLPIDLDQDCLDNPCGADSTCVHGSCTDAGVECDGNVCGIDAGQTDAAPPIDAGGCIDTPPTLVRATGLISTPRIGRATKGYALAWLDTSGEIWAAIVDANGQPVVPAQALVQLGAPVKIDAIATDTNDQNYFVVYEDTGNLSVIVIPTSGGPQATIGAPSTAGLASGAFWESTQSAWITAAIQSVASFYTVTPPAAAKFSTTFSPQGATHLALARFGTTYYPTTVEGTSCVVRTCALQPATTFSCSQAVTVPGCSALRVAADGTNLVGAYVASGTLFFQQNFSSGSPTNVGPIDDVDAMVPTVVGSTPFRVVWRGGGAIRTDTFPIRGAAVTTLDASAFGTSPGTAGFDAVADDPSETGYAVVYSRPSTPATIHFLHNCR